MKLYFGSTFIISAATIFTHLNREGAAQEFTQVNLVTDDQTAHPAALTDTSLKNAWGVSFSGSSPFWVSDNGTGVSTLYNVNPTTDFPTKIGLTVAIPGDGSVTGQAFGGLAGSFNGNNFLFVSEDGTISGWRGALGTTAEVLQSPSDAVYKGTAFADIGGNGYLYSANFHSGAIDVNKGNPGEPDLTGKFTDPNLPGGYAPFNIRNLNGKLYVTYALKGNGKDDAPGAGHGFVNEFDLQGNLLRRIGTMGTLDSPWGLEIAPASFGPLAGDLLVGNFGDGRINAFDLSNATFAGQLPGTDGNPLEVDGLWALTAGNNGSGGSSSKLYFTAGPDEESHGLFGLLQLPDSGSTASLLAAGFSVLALARKTRKA